MIEFDTETTGLQFYAHRPFLAQFFGDGKPYAISIENQGSRPDVYGTGRSIVQRALLQSDDYRAWNAKFDLHMLKADGFTLPPDGSWHDGMVLAHTIDERPSNGLIARAEKIIGPEVREPEQRIKAWMQKEGNRRRKVAKDDGTKFVPPTYEDIPRDVMLPYAVGDVQIQRTICETYEKVLANDPELQGVYDLERGVMRALFHAEERGMPVERAEAAALEAAVLTKREFLHKRCVDLAGKSNFNPDAPRQVAEALERRGADLSFVSKTPTGHLSMNEENLRTVDDDLAGAILEFRGTKGMYDYVAPLLHGSARPGLEAPFIHDERVHPSFNQVGARTGRMSCSAPNIQQWHRDDLRLRYLVKARPGYKLIACDLDAIEMRLFAAFCGEGVLLDTIRRGEDIHAKSAKAAGLRDFHRSSGAVETARQRGKRLNYLIAYAGGVRAIRKFFYVPQDEARQILRRYHKAYPEVQGLQNRIEFALEDRGYVKDLWGRRYRADGPAERVAYKYVNYLVQGSAASLLKDSLVRIHDDGIPVIACVHDEVLAEVPEEDAAEAAHLMEKHLTSHPRIEDRVPILAEAMIVDRWSDAKPLKDGSLFVPEHVQEAA
jgi:DNA polymerase-1